MLMPASPPLSDAGKEALRLHALGLRLVPLVGKTATLKNWPDLRLHEDDIRNWDHAGVNWGIITGQSLVIVDTDSDGAEAWVRAHAIESSVMVRTGRGGMHRYFRPPADETIHSRSALHGVPGLDLKGWRSYIVAAGAIHPLTRRLYEYLPGKRFESIEHLPVFDTSWLPVPTPLPVPSLTIPHPDRRQGPVRDVSAYIRRIPSVQGQGGDKACFVVACRLAEAGFTFDEALAEMERWNELCAVPRWSRPALVHKVSSAMQLVRRNIARDFVGSERASVSPDSKGSS